jgi:hypothetical protein
MSWITVIIEWISAIPIELFSILAPVLLYLIYYAIKRRLSNRLGLTPLERTMLNTISASIVKGLTNPGHLNKDERYLMLEQIRYQTDKTIAELKTKFDTDIIKM